MWHFALRLFVCLSCSTAIVAGAQSAVAQTQSVRPGINKPFETPNVKTYTGIFEREGRDAFDHRHEILKECQITPGMTMADIGAGTGLFTRMFSDAVGPEGRVYAVDISDEFIAHITEAAKREGRKNITGIICDPFDAKLPAGAIDVALICDTYHHFEFPTRTMQSIHRALKPAGTLVLVDFHRIEGKSSAFIMGHVRAGQEVFTQEIVDAGFKPVEVKNDLLKESYLIRFAKTDAPPASAPK
jgi:predicted methyltransferase